MFKLQISYYMFIVTTVVAISSINKSDKRQLKETKLEENFQNEFDLYGSLDSMKKIINFALERLSDIDANYEYGLFILNVQLKLLMKSYHKNIQDNVKAQIWGIINKNIQIRNYFNKMVKNSDDPKDKEMKLVTSLFSNESIWMTNIKKYGKFEQNIMKLENLKSLHNLEWNVYLKNVGDFQHHVPDPSLSDKCLSSLALNPVNSHNTLARCETEEPCKQMLYNGTNFGYSLSHRTLFFVMALFGRGCYIFSPLADKMFVRKLCAVMYEEVEYIAENGFGIIDLFIEHITICSLIGELKFLQPRWLSTIEKYQTPLGCFGLQPWKRGKSLIMEPPPRKWEISKVDHSLSGVCNTHMTSVTAATLAIATRALY